MQQASFCCSFVKFAVFISPRTFFPHLLALLIKLGNTKIKLMDLTLVLMAEKGTAKSLSLSFCWVDLAEQKGIKPSSRQEYQIILFQFYTLEVHSICTYTQDCRLPHQWRKNKSNFPWHSRLLTLEQFIELTHVVSPLPAKPVWEIHCI